MSEREKAISLALALASNGKIRMDEYRARVRRTPGLCDTSDIAAAWAFVTAARITLAHFGLPDQAEIAAIEREMEL